MNQPDVKQSHRMIRGKRLKLAIITSLLVRPLAVLIPLIVVPLFVRYLGKDKFGVFELVSSLGAWVGLANIGLGFGLNNRLMDCYVTGNQDLAKRYVSTLFSSMIALFGIGILLIVPLSFLVNWQAIIQASKVITNHEFQWVMFLALLFPLIGVCINLAPAIYSAYQENHRQNLWDGISKMLTIIACFSVSYTHYGLYGVLFAILGVPIVITICNHIWLWVKVKPWLSPSPSFFEFKLLRGLLTDGILLFILQSSVVLLFQADRLIIGLFRPSVEVAEYGIVSRCLMLAYGCYMLLLAPLWPAYGEAFRRGDIEWCRRKLHLTLLLGLLCMVTSGALLVLLNQQIFTLLTGANGIIPRRTLIFGMAIGCTFRAWSDAHSILLNGANVLIPQIILVGINAILTIAINMIATYHFGAVGTAWSFPIAAVLTTLWGYPFIVKKYGWSGQSLIRVHK